MAAIRQSLVCTLLVCMLPAAARVHATDDTYLKMLEGEAANVELDQSGQLETGNGSNDEGRAFSWKGKINGIDLPGGLEKEEFESMLRDNFYGTYLFFKKLNSTDKSTIYYRYSKEAKPDVDFVRENIMSLLSQ